jgi:hypothetical protein
MATAIWLDSIRVASTTLGPDDPPAAAVLDNFRRFARAGITATGATTCRCGIAFAPSSSAVIAN